MRLYTAEKTDVAKAIPGHEVQQGTDSPLQEQVGDQGLLNVASLTAIFAAGALGILAWGSSVPAWGQGAAILMPVLWAATNNRWAAGLVVMAYTTAASRGLVSGVAEFFSTNLAHGLAIWLAAGLITGLTGAACWHRSQTGRALMLPVLLLALVLPPVGLVGWAHPVTAAGWLFPGTAWLGLALTVVLAMLLAWRNPIFHALAAFLPLLTLSATLAGPAVAPEGWQGYNTAFRFGVGAVIERDPMLEIRRHWAMQSQIESSAGSVHVLPETVGGLWNLQASNDWQRLLADMPGHTVLMGAYESAEDGNYNNTMVEVTAAGSRIIYLQRFPIPVGMWKPWSDSSAVAHWLSQPGTVTVAGERVAVLICYEALLVWPVLHSVLERPAIFVSIASTWWAPESIHLSQRQAMQSWSRLFSVPLVEAYNL